MDWEFALLDGIQSTLKCGFMDDFMPIITKFGDGGIFWIAVTLLMFIPKKTRKYAHVAAIALLFCVICGNVILKPLVARIRPYDVKLVMKSLLLVKAPTDYSFPSGHTQASFAVACSICYWNRKWGIPALILAAMVAFSRMYLYVHYPTDVLAGLCFGIGFSLIGLLICNKLFRGKKEWDGCQVKS